MDFSKKVSAVQTAVNECRDLHKRYGDGAISTYQYANELAYAINCMVGKCTTDVPAALFEEERGHLLWMFAEMEAEARNG